MGSKKSPAPPATPDPAATAAAQATQNAETARVNAALNREDQYTPYGSLTYSLIGGQGGNQNSGQTLQPAANPAPQPQSQEGIWRAEGGNTYRNMNTGALETYATAPGTPGSEPGTFYGTAPTAAAAPASATQGAKPATTTGAEQRWQSTVTLAPEQQRMLDLQNQAGIKYGETANRQMSAVSDRLAAPLDFSTLGPAPTMDAAYRDQILTSMLSRQQPMVDRDRAALETQMANQGIAPGSEAWKRGMDDWSRAQTDMRLAMDARAGDEMARMYGLQGNARDRAMNEMIQQRQIPLNELAAMLSGGQVQNPSFVPTPQTQVQPVDVAGITFGAANMAQNQYAQQMANQRSGTQGLFNLAGAGLQAYATNPAAFAWSDRRLKCDIRTIGTLPSGLPVYRFRYLWSDEESTGVMADEARALFPAAVVRMPNGYDAVNYGEIA